jgi:hypothetical protein
MQKVLAKKEKELVVVKVQDAVEQLHEVERSKVPFRL